MLSSFVFDDGQIAQPVKKPEPSKDFKLETPELFDFQVLVERIAFNHETNVPISADQFEDGFNRLLELMKTAMPGIEKNIVLPGLMPPTGDGDIGSGLAPFVKAVERGYKTAFHGRVFSGPGDLTIRISFCEATGHRRFLGRKEWTIFAYVADCMRCWPVTVQRQPQPEIIQAGFSVAGCYDGFSVLALHAEVLAKGWVCPGINYSGTSVYTGGRSLYAKADDDGLEVYVSGDVGVSYDDYSGALSFVG